MLVVCQGTILRLYWIFEFGWMVTGAVMFWGTLFPFGYCDQEFGYYMWALLIISFLLIPLNLFVSGMRPEEGVEEAIITQRVTEMSSAKE